jgi:hypothetical protein
MSVKPVKPYVWPHGLVMDADGIDATAMTRSARPSGTRTRPSAGSTFHPVAPP